MIKDRLKEIVERALSSAIKDGKLGSVSEGSVPVVIERPKLSEHGDLACGIALKLASQAKAPPIKIAETIAQYIEKDGEGRDALQRFDVAPPGFINFKLSSEWLKQALKEINQQKSEFGKSNIGGGERVLIEYVSANPTGELHIGHGRNAVYGSCLANLLKFVGYEVEQEFYVNDAGEQIAQLGECAWALYQRKLGRPVPYPESGYPEYSLEPFIETILERMGNTHGSKASEKSEKAKELFMDLPADEGAKKLGDLTIETVIDDQRALLEKLGIRFDRWFSERKLHADGKVDEVLEFLHQRGMTYESEGAVWLKSKELGDERDRVLRKSAGAKTYLAADAAYHRNKYGRGFKRFITIWGADHHGQVPGLKAAVRALGEDPDRMEIILTQIVNLSRDGQIVRMSKRMGTVVTLKEVTEEVGVDAVRYYLAESNPANPINFDLELAKKTSRENPAFYIQYAHARCCQILRRALEPHVNPESGATDPPLVTADQWEQFTKDYESTESVFDAAFDADPQIFFHQKALVMRLQSFPEEVKEAAITRLPGRLARFAYDLANDLQKFYEESRVITDDLSVTKARLGLILATRQVLANVLGIIGVSAPERM